MARRSLCVLAMTLLGWLAVSAAPALAGAGCHSAPTTGRGDTVELRDMCFTPTTLRIAPGDAVTFVNRDTIVHMVGGTGWGHFEDLIAGATFTATFDEPGIYPYACIYHPGMTGAIVVGDGIGAGDRAEVAVAPYEAAAPSSGIRAAGGGGGGSPIGWFVGGALGLAAGLAGGLVARRRAVRDAIVP
jgi:plastocyanin